MHYLYLISTDHGHRTKIGHSRNPRRRMADMQVANSKPLALDWIWRGDRARIIALETRLHQLFEWAHVRGEWHDVKSWDVRPVVDALFAKQTGRAREAAGLLRIEAMGDDEARDEIIAGGMSGNEWDEVLGVPLDRAPPPSRAVYVPSLEQAA